jgi:hypothetical protein
MSETTNKFSSKVRERAIRRVLDHEQEHPPLGGDQFDRNQYWVYGADV